MLHDSSSEEEEEDCCSGSTNAYANGPSIGFTLGNYVGFSSRASGSFANRRAVTSSAAKSLANAKDGCSQAQSDFLEAHVQTRFSTVSAPYVTTQHAPEPNLFAANRSVSLDQDRQGHVDPDYNSIGGNCSFQNLTVEEGSPLDSDVSLAQHLENSAKDNDATAAAGTALSELTFQQDQSDLKMRALLEDEEELRKRKLQLYVLVMRCIAYPFNAKQPADLQRRQTKITRSHLAALKERFDAFLQGETQIAADEAFINAAQSYLEVFLKSDRVANLVKSGGCGMNDFRDVFKNNIEKRVRLLPEIDGLSKETVLTSWMTKFDQICRRGDDEDPRQSAYKLLTSQSELILSKEQLYDMFQTILGIKKFDHHILFNALQLDNMDEQAAQVRRELDTRSQMVENMRKNRKYPKFVVKDMELMYGDELRSGINLLMQNLEAVPVSKGTDGRLVSLHKLKKRGASTSTAATPTKSASGKDGASDDGRLDIRLNFSIEVVVMEVRGLKFLPPNKIVYCTMEVGGEKLQTDQAEASKPMWDTQGDFSTSQPLPVIKVKLYTENSRLLALDDKQLGRILIKPTCTGNRHAEWFKMTRSKHCPDELKIKVVVCMEKPSNLKYCGYLWLLGKHVFKKWKKRYVCLIQVSQYRFVMASYQEQKSEWLEYTILDGFTVDYCDARPELIHEGGKYFFNIVKEGSDFVGASDDENERQMWVQAVYRATGQTHKPTPPSATPAQKISNRQMTRLLGDADKARKHGLEEYVTADPSAFNHNDLFRLLQRLSLEFRLNDSFASLGWFSPGQVFVMDEYCARYGVRDGQKHIIYLGNLLERAEQGVMIDPALMHFSFAFCAGHVHGNGPGGIGTVLSEERYYFDDIKERLRTLLIKQITEFRYCFPFGRPEGALKATISLLERVLMKDVMTPVSPTQVRSVIKECLDQAALVNYTRISEYAQIEAQDGKITREKRLEDVIHLAELCIEVLQQNEEHHAEAFAWFNDLLVEHADIFWSLFSLDMMTVLDDQPEDQWDCFPLFQLLNDYLRNDANLCHGRFHMQLREVFAPQVVRYVDLMESSLTQSINRGFEREKWNVKESGRIISEDLLWKLDALQSFIADLHWPDEVFAEHLDNRLKLMASDMLQAASKRALHCFEQALQRSRRGTDFVVMENCCCMINTLLEMKCRTFKLCKSSRDNVHKYHIVTEKNLETQLQSMCGTLISKLLDILQIELVGLARYDESNLFSSILTITKQDAEAGKNYTTFVSSNLQAISSFICDEIFVLDMLEMWYSNQMQAVLSWLQARQDNALHNYQLNYLLTIIKKVYSEFELQGVGTSILNSQMYKIIITRLQSEEAIHSVKPEASSKSRSIFSSITGGVSSLSHGFPNGLSNFAGFLPK